MRKISPVVVCLVLAWCHAAGAAPAKSYAVVVSRKTHADKAWRQVVEALRAKHDARVLTYASSPDETRVALSVMMPRYICFVAAPGEAGRKFVVAVHRMTRQLDADPYTDAIWGILTGYDAADALRIAQRARPLTVKRALSGTSGLDLGVFEQGVKFNEGKAGAMVVKTPDGSQQARTCPPDSTETLVALLNEGKSDFFFTSGHATERDWQIGYSFKGGALICRNGQLLGRDVKGKLHKIDSPNPKVYIAAGNCLIGHIPARDCMATAWMHTGGVCQFVGYTVLTWFGRGGWGTRDVFFRAPGRFSLAEAFYLNNQHIVHHLQTNYPARARVNFPTYDLQTHRGLLGSLARTHGLIRRGAGGRAELVKDAMGMLWDRDTVALYGDPAWQARLAPAEHAWSQTLAVKGRCYTLALRANRDGAWPAGPVSAFLPHRVRNVTLRQGAPLKPVITDNFILVPLAGKFKKGGEVNVVFEADRIVTSSAEVDAEVGRTEKTLGLLDEKARPRVYAALGRAGANRGELLAAVNQAKAEHRPAVAFLIANMPDRDLTSLTGKFIHANVELAFLARAKAPWGKNIPEDIFLNDVLPYANVNERRDDWRKDFYDRFAAGAWACKTPGKAAEKLNREIFKALKVTYHATKRPKPDQSPYESTAAAYASCTGLSVLLADACRAAGIPARLAGTPMWVDRKGNHTWVEVWDGRWHYIGAWDGKVLDKAWFTKKAADCAAAVAADGKKWSHRIFAASFRRTALHFPLSWNMSVTYVPAVDVTGFYAAQAQGF